MLNFIRGDFYRLVHTKGFWITQAFVFGLVLVAIFAGSGFSLQVNGENVSQGATPAAVLNGYIAIQQGLNGLLFYLNLPLIILVLGSEYSKGTLKNVITTGMSRTKYFFSKFISYVAVLLLQISAVTVFCFIVGYIFGGSGFDSSEQVWTVLYNVAGVTLLLSAIASVVIMGLYLSKNTAISVIIAILVPMFIMVVHFTRPDWSFLEYIDFQMALDNLVAGSINDFSSILPTFIGALVVTVLGLIGSNLIFNKQDF